MTPLRVAVLAESETDDIVALEIAAYVRQVTVEAVPVPSLRVRNWHSMLRQLPVVVRTVYYQSDADALVVLADTDATTPHVAAHGAGARPPDCRWCLLTEALAHAQARRGPRPAGTLLRTAVGTPVPAVEGWLLAGRAAYASEAAWLRRGTRAAAASEMFKRELKHAAYGSGPPYPDKANTASKLIRGALATPGALRTAFPGGYGPLEDAIVSW